MQQPVVTLVGNGGCAPSRSVGRSVGRSVAAEKKIGGRVADLPSRKKKVGATAGATAGQPPDPSAHEGSKTPAIHKRTHTRIEFGI